MRDKPERLTDLWVKNLKPEPGTKEDEFIPIDDTPGLLLKVTPQGKRVWVFRHRFGKPTPSRRRLGRYPGMSLAEAREKARQWQALLDEGRDPLRRLKLTSAKLSGKPVRQPSAKPSAPHSTSSEW